MLTLNRSAYEAQTPARFDLSREQDRRRDVRRQLEGMSDRLLTLSGQIERAIDQEVDLAVNLDEIECVVADTLEMWTEIRNRINPGTARREARDAAEGGAP